MFSKLRVLLPLFPQLIILLTLLSITPLATAKNAQVAIIIDDIGYRKSDAAVLTLPGAITFAILPHTPYGKRLALEGYHKNNEIILHIPMEAENGKKLGPGALTVKMNEESIRHQLALAFAEIPFAIGINNHMGSKLTKLYNPMMWTMRFLKERDLMLHLSCFCIPLSSSMISNFSIRLKPFYYVYALFERVVLNSCTSF
tara:strand:- start:392 stop:991 length:600 start_codon:yes stop_codon:yes gene_type:complete